MPHGSDPQHPNYARPEYYAVVPDLKLIQDEMGGTRAMHAASKGYIRKWSAEKPANYDIRRTCETFFEGFGRTLSAGVGMLFAKEPQMEWNGGEGTIETHAENIDGAGTDLDVFAKRFAEAAIRDGLAAILVDHPPPPVGEGGEAITVTAENEVALNLRPTWALYSRSQILNWRTATVNNQDVLTLVALAERAEVPDGPFGVRFAERYRVLRLLDGVAAWTLYELRKGDGAEDAFVEVDSGVFRDRTGKVATVLPIAVGYAGRTDAPLTASIPLLGVAWANLGHWQLSTSLRFNSEVAGFAQPTVTGNLARDPVTGGPMALEIGPLVTVQVEAGGDFKWTEPAGTGLERIALLVLEKLRQIAAQGVSFLSQDTRAAETAEAKRLDAAAENATLATAAVGISDAINTALATHAWYLGIAASEAPTMTMSHDFEDTTLAADIMTAYVNGVANAGLPVRLLLKAWQAGGRIGPDEDLEAMEMEIMANQAAAAAEKRAEAERLAAQRQDPELSIAA